MRDLKTPPPHPERLPYLRTGLAICDWIRLPTSGQYLDAATGAEGLIGAASHEHKIGALVGRCWRDHTRALEETEPREVFTELYAEGYSENEIAELAAFITEQVSARLTSEAEVEDAVDFTEGTPQTEPSA